MPLPAFPQQDDRQIVYDTHGNPVQSPSTNGPTAEIVVADSDFPYNLKFERDIDVFTLSWDWVDTADFKAAGFKVFNGSTQVAAVTGNSAANIRLAAPDGNYTYTVAAFDANGRLSRFSVPITVEPGDQSAHAEFFAWLEQYFGELPVLSTDDSGRGRRGQLSRISERHRSDLRPGADSVGQAGHLHENHPELGMRTGIERRRGLDDPPGWNGSRHFSDRLLYRQRPDSGHGIPVHDPRGVRQRNQDRLEPLRCS